MKVALTVWDGWISPVFDVCQEARVLTIDRRVVISTTKVNLGNMQPLQKIELLVGMGVETLVCGAISETAHALTSPKGLKVIGFVAGEFEEVVKAFLSGKLPSRALSMPGCCRRQQRQRRGRGFARQHKK